MPLPCRHKDTQLPRGGRAGQVPTCPSQLSWSFRCSPGSPRPSPTGQGASCPQQGCWLLFPGPGRRHPSVIPRGAHDWRGARDWRGAGLTWRGTVAPTHGGPPCRQEAELGRCRSPRATPPGTWAQGVSAEGLTGLCLVLQATLRRRLSLLETQAMWSPREPLLLWLLVLAAGSAEHVYRPG